MSRDYLGEDDLIYNTSSRVPVCLCLDTSGSMYDCIDELVEGVNAFYKAIREDEVASKACEIAVVTFNSSVNVIENFSTIDKKTDITSLRADGGTNMGEGVTKALELLEERKNEYKNNGIEYFQPWLVLMSDGAPTDRVKSVQKKTMEMSNNKKLSVFCLAIGEYADTDVLGGFSKRAVLRLKGLKFKEFFEWLGKSVSVVSNSKVGETIKLDTTELSEFSEI